MRDAYSREGEPTPQSIELNVEPRFKERWEDFLQHCGPNAIALDGRVIGATRRDFNLPAANLNHHEDVDRITNFRTVMLWPFLGYGYLLETTTLS